MTEIRRKKFAKGFEYKKTSTLFSSKETSRVAQFFRIVPAACFVRTVEGSWLMSLQKSTGMLENQPR